MDFRCVVYIIHIPKFNRNPLTVAIMRDARTGNRFKWKGGTEYRVPNKRPIEYNINICGEKFSLTIDTPDESTCQQK